MLAPCRWARARYAAALIDYMDAPHVGSPRWFMLELVAAVGWPLNAVRFWRDLFALHTAHPGDVWADSQRELHGTVLRVDSRGTWLRVVPDEWSRWTSDGSVLLVPRYRYVAWSPRRRGWLS